MWLDLLQHDFQVFTLLRPAPIQGSAYADACADTTTAGLGGFVRLPSGACAFFRCTLDRRALQSLASWYDPALPPQSFISAWELLAQLGLLWLLHTMLPIGHPPVLMDLHCDNSAAESASWKALSTALGLSRILSCFLYWQHALAIQAHVMHVPGVVNDVADGLSRSFDPNLLGFQADQEVHVPWLRLLSSDRVRAFPPDLREKGWIAALA
jgi:hypothetical protein